MPGTIMGRHLNPAAINDAAANLFWRRVSETSISVAQGEVLETSGYCLLDYDWSDDVLAPYKLQDVSEDERALAMERIADEALIHLREEKNLQGIIYAEDMETGRSPSATSLSTDHISYRPQKIKQPMFTSSLGVLCLRSPLPACLFSTREPLTNVLRVKSTEIALGFEYPMFLALQGVQKVHDKLFALMGIFYIPVPPETSDADWNSLIPNSTRFHRGATLLTGKKSFDIGVKW